MNIFKRTKTVILALALVAAPCFSEEDPAPIQSTTARNEQIVVEFINKIFNERADIATTAHRYVAKEFIQHNPNIATGRAALITALENWLPYVPGQVADIKRVISSGDLVVLHIHYKDSNSPDLGTAGIDIFRVNKRGKIVEHWDVLQPIPEQSANTNGMF